MPQDNWESTCK